MMDIIEQAIVGKRPGGQCEDGMVLTPHYAAVIDGSTSKSALPPLTDGMTRGQAAMEAVRAYVQQADAELGVEEFCQGATQCVRDLYDRYYTTDVMAHMQAHTQDRFCCSAIVYSRARNQVWMIGDCQALVIAESGQTHLTNDKPYEAILASRRAGELTRLMAQGVSVDEIRRHDAARDVIIPQMLEMMRGQNVTYAVVDGFSIPMQHVRVYTLPAHTRELILASDGYLRLCPTLHDTELYLHDYLQHDPLLMHRHQATKAWMLGNASFDDRSYLRLKIKD